jgi:outer membrane protein assembly factor BamB
VIYDLIITLILGNAFAAFTSVFTSFTYDAVLVFIGTCSGGMFCLNQATGEMMWSKQINQPVMASPGIIKDKVFFATSDKKDVLFTEK